MRLRGARVLLSCSLSLACACADGADEQSSSGSGGAGASAQEHAGTGGHAGSPSTNVGGFGHAGGSWLPPIGPCDRSDGSDIRTFVKAADVGATLGGSVQFVGAASERELLADLAARESMVVAVHIGDEYRGECDSFEVLRLPAEHRQRRLLAHAGSGYWLACSYADCGIFEPAADARQLQLIAGSLFTGGIRFTGLQFRDTRLCASGPTVDALCFDGEMWTDELGDPTDPNAVAGSSPPAGVDPTLPPPAPSAFANTSPVHCPVGSEVTEPLLVVHSGYRSAHGVTADGRLVSGAYGENDELASCSYSSAPFGAPVWFGIWECGLSVNESLVTAEAYYGSNECILD